MRHDTDRVSLLTNRMPDHIVLTIRGELDIATSAHLRDHIAGILDDATVPMIVDLFAVSGCDASGLAVLVGAQRRARQRGLTIVLSQPSPEVSEILRINGLAHAFTTYATLAAARSDLGYSSHPAVA